MSYGTRLDFSVLTGETLAELVIDDRNDQVVFKTVAGRKFRLCHHQDCCESVHLESVQGDVTDVLGQPIIEATARYESGTDEAQDSVTQSWYTIVTSKGRITIRWYGSSNGYYSESADFEEIGA